MPNQDKCWCRLTGMGAGKYRPKNVIPKFPSAFFGFKLNEILCESLKAIFFLISLNTLS